MTAVRDAPEHHRFELVLDDAVVGFADYRVSDGVITLPHVETDPQHRGNGFAAKLMDGVVAIARERDLSIRPLCGYAASYIRERPETHDVIAR